MIAYRRQGHSIMDRNLQNIEEYTKEDLMSSEGIEMICNNYCDYHIHITKTGWMFLIEHYGYEGLYEIDKKCSFGFYHWYEHVDNSLGAYKKWINDRIESYPHVPDSVYKADTPEGIARAALHVGKTVEEVVALFEMPFTYVQKLDKEVQEAKKEKEREQKIIRAMQALRHDKVPREVAEECDLPFEYVVQLDKARKESEVRYEKIQRIPIFLKNGKSEEEIARELDIPLEYVQDCVRKILKSWKNSKS